MSLTINKPVKDKISLTRKVSIFRRQTIEAIGIDNIMFGFFAILTFTGEMIKGLPLGWYLVFVIYLIVHSYILWQKRKLPIKK